MARYSNVTTNFSGGLVTDHLVSRTDVNRMSNSARKFDNFLPTLQGPAEYRPGFQRIADETDEDMITSVSSFVIFNTDVVYRVVFGAGKAKVYNTDGTLIDTVTTPYAQSELVDLRFSSETDELHIAHPNHKPRVFTGGIGYSSATVQDSANKDLVSSDGFTLRSLVQVTGAGSWTLSEVDTEIEPFLDPDTSDNQVRVEKDQEIAKIVTTDNLSQITGAGAGNYTDFYVEYELNGKKILGKVLDSTSSTNYAEVADPSVDSGTYTVYVDAVDFISEVTAPSAKLFLLDNTDAEVTDSSIQHKQLIQEGVPDDEVHLRSDVDIFNNGNVGSFIRLSSATNRSDKVLLGQDSKFSLTRWVKISEYVGVETHPVDFFTGDQYIEETSATHDYTEYDNGSIYKAYGDSEFSIRDIAGAEAGQIRADGNRVFVWNGGEFTGDFIHVFNADISRSSNDLTFDALPTGHGIKVGDTINISGLTVTSGTSPNGDQTVAEVAANAITFNISSLSHDPTGDATLVIKSHSTGTGTSVVGNLTTAKSFEVVKCDPTIVVQLYDAVSNTGGKLLSTTVANTTVTEIANDVLIKSSLDLFDATTSTDRFFKGELPSGMVYAKILEFTNTKHVRARLKSVVPRDPVSGEFENKGVFKSFSLGAWYTNNYPRAVGKYEQRRVYGGTYANPNFVFFSRLNDETNFAPTQEDKQVLDTDGISYGLSNVNASVRWIKAGTDLVFGTSNGVFKLVTNQFSAAVSPKTIRLELVDEVGCESDGVLAGTSIFFPDESNSELLEYKYDSNIARDTTNDVSKFIYPTFVKDKILKVEFQNNPQPRLWVVTTDGLLYVLTYHRQEDYYAWSKHTTDGSVLDITVLRKGFRSGIDQVWITVYRDDKYYYERLFSEVDSLAEPTYYLDNATVLDAFNIGANKSGDTLTLAISDHDNGTVLDVVIDDIYVGSYTVTSGNLSIDTSKDGISKIVYGKTYTGTLQMMYPTWNAQNRPAFGAEESRIVSQKVFTIESHRFKQGLDGKHVPVKLPGFSIPATLPDSGTLSAYTGFDKERPLVNSQFGVEKLPELVQDQPYKTVFGSLITKTDLN